MLDSELRQATEEVIRAHDELLLRLGQQGVSGVAELAETFERLRRASQAYSREELDTALVRVGALLDQLRATRQQVEELSQMRNVLLGGGDANGAGGTGGSEEALD